jgi:hypothetical protein
VSNPPTIRSAVTTGATHGTIVGVLLLFCSTAITAEPTLYDVLRRAVDRDKAIAAAKREPLPDLFGPKVLRRVYPIPGFTLRQLELMEETDQYYRDLNLEIRR